MVAHLFIGILPLETVLIDCPVIDRSDSHF